MADWKKVESEILRLDTEGDYLEGTLVDIAEGDFENKKYTIKNLEGKNIVIFGTTMLDDLLKMVKVGQEVKIVNIGEKATKKKGQNPMRLFDVFVK